MSEKQSQDRDGRSLDAREFGAAGTWPVVVRSFEPVPDLDERRRQIYALLILPPYPLDE
jgi:hypothetical protein